MQDNSSNQGLYKDEEFERLIAPLSYLERQKLSFKILSSGTPAIRTWNNIIICDSDIYKVCTDYRMPYTVIKKSFINRDDAISYICRQELKHDAVSNEYKRYILGKLFRTEKRMHSKDTTIQDICKSLAEEFNNTASVINKYGAYSKALDNIFSIKPEISKAILSQQLRVSHECTVEIARLPRDELNSLFNMIKDKPFVRLTFPEIQQELRWKKHAAFSTLKSIQRQDDHLEIRKIPQYDPDAQISSLALTIPSWISSINRAVDNTDFSKISDTGRANLRKQLLVLDETIRNVRISMEV